MKNQLKNLYYACREICQGSGRISILSVFIITVILYCLFFGFTNSALLPLVLGNIEKTTDYNTTKTYLDTLTINTEIFSLFPILCTIILLIPSTNQLKSNILNRLLPIATWTRLLAFIFIILISTSFSYLIVQLLEYCTVQYLRGKYMQEVITVQESYGDLYSYYLPNSSLFSPNYTLQFKSLQDWRSILILSLVFNSICLVMNTYFNKYSIIKGVSIILVILYIAFNIRSHLVQDRSETLSTNSFTYETVYYFYFPILFLLFICSFYYLLKQKER